MGRSVRIRPDCLTRVQSALLRNGFFSQRDFVERLSTQGEYISQGTVSKFLNGKPVDRTKFIMICEALGLEWLDVAYLEFPLEESNTPAQQNNSPEFSPFTKGPASSLQEQVLNVTHSQKFPLRETVLEYPEGSVALDSPFYVERPPKEKQCYEEISKHGSLIRIKAPKQMGKSSLLLRILHTANKQGHVTVTLKFKLAESEFFTNINTFLRWFCDSLTQELTKDNPQAQDQLFNKLDQHWNLCKRIGSLKTCGDYFERYVFPEIGKPLTLALEEVDRLFEYPKIYGDFFALLRSWHEEAKQRDIWKQLRLVIVHSMENPPMDINRSPFNAGLPIELQEFTDEQVLYLAHLHQLNWHDAEVQQLMALIGGHPFLVRLALYYVARQEITFSQLLQTASNPPGIYKEHLQSLEALVAQQELVTAMREVAAANVSVRLESTTRFKLYGLGLVKLRGDEVTPRCELYRQYFQNK
jgi:transcriptional regulator with XRE-family HTH domain